MNVATVFLYIKDAWQLYTLKFAVPWIFRTQEFTEDVLCLKTRCELLRDFAFVIKLYSKIKI